MDYERIAEGHCPVCSAAVRFVAGHPWLRDHYRCQSCGSIPRERALFAVLETRFPRWRRMRIHESSPGPVTASAFRRACSKYTGSQYYAQVEKGETAHGFRCEDLERQTFADDSFDLVVTLDVLEHVLDWHAALREIARTLAPGGAHVFTTPMYRELSESRVRAKRRGDSSVELLAEPEYHGNPVDASGSLVTVHWGYDLPKLIHDACGLATETIRLYDPGQGIEGEFIEVFVTRKPDHPTHQRLRKLVDRLRA